MKIKSKAPPDVTHRIQKSLNIKPSDTTLQVKKLSKPDTQSMSKFAGLQIPKNSSSSFTQQAETCYASSSKIIMKKLNNVKNSSLSNENIKFLKTFSEPAHNGFIIPEPTDPGPPVTKKNRLFGFPIKFSNKRLKSIICQITDTDIKHLDPDRYLNNTLIEYGLLLWQWGLEMTYPAKMDTIYRQLKHAKKPSSKRRRIEEPKNAPSKGICKSKPEYEQEEEENDNDKDEEVSGSDESNFDTTMPKFAKYRKIIEEALRVSYNFFKSHLGDRFETLLVEAINESRLKHLIRKMYIQVSDGISQDVRSLKERILDYVEDTLDEEMYPRIKRGAKKSHTRGFWHPQLARLLVPATMLEKFQADPDLFCQQYRNCRLEGSPILSTHIPSFFYADLGNLVSCDFQMIFSGLLEGQLITLVHLYLGKENATEYQEYYRNLRNTGDNKKFTVKKAGKAYQRKITSISFPMIAYTMMIIWHSLASCDNRRRKEGSVDKVKAFKACMAMANDPSLYNKAFLKRVNKYYTELVGWMLPEETKPPLQNDEDPHCGLSLMSKVLDLETEEQKAADKAEAKAKAEAAKEGKKREQQKDKDLPSDTNADIVPSSRSNTLPPPSLDWDARPSSQLSIELGAKVDNNNVVAKSEDETQALRHQDLQPASKPSSSSSQHSSSALKKTMKSKPKAKTTTLTSSSSEPDCSDTRSKDTTKIKKLQPLPRKKAVYFVIVFTIGLSALYLLFVLACIRP
ncbi:hypothetical protein D9757_015284 [Collybiopsis confluens]|uniref:Uncharacterized protein n=1 Tax=Collybiopsis confluens TaxID=2823264 RepID=A0A8H5C9F1_9AGAR|nr:hypothetical protein D9757_015284 [Collybiopsis confluens]